MRTFSMMLGDLDYINTFVNPYNCGGESEDSDSTPMMSTFTSSANNETIQTTCCADPRNLCSDRRRLPYPFASFAILAVFMVFMPILLMNLLIGLAVGDIESVRRNAQLKRLAMQVLIQIHHHYLAATGGRRVTELMTSFVGASSHSTGEDTSEIYSPSR